jgi:beta-aspartyl-peptidase (threonine type)
MNKIAIAIHGGAGTILKSSITKEQDAAYRKALKQSLHAGYAALEQKKTAVEAVELAIIELENSPLFNAGNGAVFTNQETHEMDASIMEGKDLNAGTVTLIHNIKNPISLAKLVMEKSEHVMLGADGAMEFAREMGCAMEKDSYFYDEFRHKQWLQAKEADLVQLDHTTLKNNKIGTTGAVALDVYGNLAAGTSTGGVTNKKYGRIGDSPIIGSGTYANNVSCAISCTGTGEFFIRGVVAYDVSCLMEYKGLSLADACHEVVHNRLLKIGGDGGLIGVDANGYITMSFNTEGMYRAYKQSDQPEVVAIYKENDGVG